VHRGENGKLAERLCATATLSDDCCLVVLVLRPTTTDKAWARIAKALPLATRQIAEAVSLQRRPAVEEQRTLLSSRGWYSGFFLLTPQLNVEWYSRGPSSKELGALEPREGRLPELLERTVRRLTSSWDFARPETCLVGTACPIPGIALRVVPMSGSGTLIGVFLEPFAGRHSIDHAAKTFGVSPRELEVLHALLDGHSIAETAVMLGLAESTVNDHIARLNVRTNSRNRVEMVATMLGWPVIRSRMLAPDPGKLRGSRSEPPRTEDSRNRTA
jgi:DNA-binding CsgD family transcriptional regulator